MSSLNTLLLAVDLAARKRDAANQALAETEQALMQARGQMAQLETYARETEARWALQSQRATTPELMSHHYQFMGRLQQAMDMQGSILREREGEVLQAKAAVLQMELRLASLHKVCEKKRDDAVRVQQRREQKEIDEIAASHYRATANQHFGRKQT